MFAIDTANQMKLFFYGQCHFLLKYSLMALERNGNDGICNRKKAETVSEISENKSNTKHI